jgi:hypothetical protein
MSQINPRRLLKGQGAQECRRKVQAGRRKELRLSVILLASALFPRAGFDIAVNVAADLRPQEVRYADQIIGGNATTVDQRIATAHRLQGKPLFVFFVDLGQIGEGLVELGNGLSRSKSVPRSHSSRTKGFLGSRFVASPTASSATRVGHCTKS